MASNTTLIDYKERTIKTAVCNWNIEIISSLWITFKWRNYTMSQKRVYTMCILLLSGELTLCSCGDVPNPRMCIANYAAYVRFSVQQVFLSGTLAPNVQTRVVRGSGGSTGCAELGLVESTAPKNTIFLWELHVCTMIDQNQFRCMTFVVTAVVVYRTVDPATCSWWHWTYSSYDW